MEILSWGKEKLKAMKMELVGKKSSHLLNIEWAHVVGIMKYEFKNFITIFCKISIYSSKILKLPKIPF